MDRVDLLDGQGREGLATALDRIVKKTGIAVVIAVHLLSRR